MEEVEHAPTGDAAGTVRPWLEARLDRYLDLLRRWVGQNSYTWNAPGVDRLGEMTAEAFAPLGITAVTEPAATPGMGRHLLLTRPGTGPAALSLVTHLDTVYPAEEEAANHFAWREEGARIYGPGVLDIKGGTLMILMILEALHAHEPALFEAVTWQVWADACEEEISDDFCEWVRAGLAPGTRAVLVFEGVGTGDVPVLVGGRKGRARFDVIVHGRAAHAGASHARGANAIVQAARVVESLAELTDYTRERTVNVGSIRGGDLVNRVPDLVTLAVEMRAHDPDVFAEGIAAIESLGGPGSVTSADGEAVCRVTVAVDRIVPPWPFDEATESLMAVWRAAGESQGITVGCQRRGGLSDGNLLWQAASTLDGLGPRGAHAHCARRSPDGVEDQEYIERTSLAELAALHTEAIRRLML